MNTIIEFDNENVNSIAGAFKDLFHSSNSEMVINTENDTACISIYDKVTGHCIKTIVLDFIHENNVNYIIDEDSFF